MTRDLKRVKPKGSPSEILLLGKYDPSGKSNIIEDPYFVSTYVIGTKALSSYGKCSRGIIWTLWQGSF